MNKILYYSLILVCFITTSCSEWLDVQPKTKVKKDKMFETEKGYKNVLSGVYINLKNKRIYGENLTMSTIEHLARHWNVEKGSTGEALNNFDYEHQGVKDKMSSIYGILYNTITNVNSLLENIDENRGIFSEGMYELIKGEALAIRAYCHFDIMRLFGPVPTTPSSGIKLSYVKTVSNKTHSIHSYEEFTKFILDDLNEAEELLGKVDPVIDFAIDDLNLKADSDFQPEDTYWAFRKFRMNYYTVLGLKARFFQWTQDKVNAYKYARMVIDAKNENGMAKYRLGQEVDFSNRDFTLSSEHIFGLNVFDLEDTSLALFEKEGTLNKTAMYLMFYAFQFKFDDLRFSKLWTTITATDGKEKFVIKKYWQTDNLSMSQKQVIPLMRLAEMYLIAIECAPISECNSLYAEFCKSRNIQPYTFTANENRSKKILREYLKEFYAEGHMFYTYKRLAVENILMGGIADPTTNYVVPLPDSEIIAD